MTESRCVAHINPGRGLGWMNLGSSMHEIITRLKASPQVYRQIDLSYSSTDPIHDAVVVNLPANGLRLRFDGPDQRLRLIEILDFSKNTFFYKKEELVKLPSNSNASDPTSTVSGPSFKHIYNRLFGPAYAGEYTPPLEGQPLGTYILSYPGLAIRFGLKHRSWSEKADFVTMLNAAATPAQSMAIFPGSSWPESRDSIFTKPPPCPRSIALAGKNAENVPDEIENILINGGGRIEMVRRSSPSFTIILSETTPQDLVAELGPPDAIFHKTSTGLSIHAASQPNRNIVESPTLDPSSVDTDRSSSGKSFGGLDNDSDSEEARTTNPGDEMGSEMFYNYFHHGFDVCVSKPMPKSPSFPGVDSPLGQVQVPSEHKLVATKLFLHANIPGSYTFNRHRRSRWTIPFPSQLNEQPLTSEMNFSKVSKVLRSVWKDATNNDSNHHHHQQQQQQQQQPRGMVLNRGWGESPESSIELLGEMEDSSIDNNNIMTTMTMGVSNNHSNQLHDQNQEEGGIVGRSKKYQTPEISSNSQLFGFPGMLFEVVSGDLISCVTIY